MKRIICLFAVLLTQVFCWGSDSLFCDRLDGSISLPVFAEGKETLGKGEKIAEKLRPILRERIKEINYDRTYAILQFLDHFETSKQKNPDITPLEAFKLFKFDPTLLSHKGGSCVSLTLDLFSFLPDGINGYVVAAKLPKKFHQFCFPALCHTAVLIKYRNLEEPSDKGFILLDPSFDIAEPVLLREGGDPFYYDLGEKGIWKFFMDGHEIVCDTLNEHQKEELSSHEDWQMKYRTDQLLNPVESSAMPMIPVDRRLSLLSRREDGTHLVHMNIELNKNRVIWDQDGNKFEPIPFESFLNGWSFPDFFSKKLSLSGQQLREIVLRIIKNKKTIDTLYFSYLSLINETQDFSVVGSIDETYLEEVLSVPVN